jgi:ATP-binding cassette, subfamily B, bacterial
LSRHDSRPLRYTWALARYQPGLFTANVALWAVYNLLPLATGLLTRAFFDALSGHARAGLDAWTVVVLLTAVGAARTGTFGVAVRLHARLWVLLESLLRRNLLHWKLLGPGAHPAVESPGQAVTRYREDVGEVPDYIIELWVEVWGNLLFALLAVGFMASIAPAVTAAAMVPIVGVALVTQYLSRCLRRFRIANLEATARVTGFIGEAFGAHQAVKAATAEHNVVRHLRRLGETRRRAAVADAAFGMMTGESTSAVVDLCAALVLLLSASTMRSGRFTVGDFGLFATYLTQLSGFMGYFGELLARHRRAQVSYDRLDEHLDGAPVGTLVAPEPV